MLKFTDFMKFFIEEIMFKKLNVFLMMCFMMFFISCENPAAKFIPLPDNSESDEDNNHADNDDFITDTDSSLFDTDIVVSDTDSSLFDTDIVVSDTDNNSKDDDQIFTDVDFHDDDDFINTDTDLLDDDVFTNTPPTIISTFPENEAVNVSMGTTIEIHFSELIDEDSLEDAFSIKDSSDTIVMFAQLWRETDNTAVITPSVILSPATTYTVTASTAICDIEGACLENEFQFSFTTSATCGNGTIEESEQCDLGINNGNCSTCTSNCKIKPANFCGDGYRCGSEICETGESTSCTSALETTSTGIVNCNLFCTGWMSANICTRINTCPAKPSNSEWNSVSSFTQTWTGMLWSPADDLVTEYNADPSDTHCRFICSSGYAWNDVSLSCVPGGCGNGITEPGEECDDGNIINTDGCKNDCTHNICGDGYLNIGTETCESTDSVSCTSALGTSSSGTAPCNSTCTGWETASNCTRTYICSLKPQNTETIYNTVSSYTQTWNGSEWIPEDDTETEYNVSESTTSCRYTCNTNYTWDGSSCNPPACGNNITEFGEECDDGNEINNDSCRKDCTINRSPICTVETLCYDNTSEMTCPVRGTEFFGQDAQYLNSCRMPDYTVTGTSEKVITDNNTGLMWQNSISNDLWNLAKQKCNNLVYGGYDDWRLPDIHELETIIDYGRSNPAVNAAIFPNTNSTFWSSTVDLTGSNMVFTVNFQFGRITGTDNSGGMLGGSYAPFRCVRGFSLPVQTFIESTIEGDVVITDSSTDLIWTKETVSGKTWKDALSYCENLSYAGHTNWRLPNINELKSLTDRSKYNPASYFPDITSEYFWSSSSMTDSGSTHTGWVVNFYNGKVSNNTKTNTYFVRCVKDPIPADSLCGTGLSLCENGETTDCTTLLGEGISGSATCNNSCDDWDTAWNCTRTHTCPEKPDAGTQWNTVSEYSQIWNGNSWKPDNDGTTEYNITGSSNSCQYICADGYSWNSTSGLCVESDICGNGLVESGEECDDGNTTETDYCLNSCVKTTRYPVCTGQSKCYNNTDEIECPASGSDFYGQDAQYSSTCIPRNFSVSGSEPEETVIDSNSRLEWQKTISTDEYNWNEAKNYCTNLNYAGYSDWRLPTSLELGTLPDYGKIKPAVNTELFPLNYPAQDQFWSSSLSNSFGEKAWTVMSYYGHLVQSDIITESSVRCVRGLSIPPYTFKESTVEGKIIVNDTVTDLIWTKETVSGKTWKDALSYCENLSYAGYTDWRLPNINELKTILNHNIKYKPYSSFPGIPEGRIWSSSAFKDLSATTAWAVGTNSGEVWMYTKTNLNIALCVR